MDIGLFSVWCYYEWNSYKHCCLILLVKISKALIFYWVNTQERNYWVIWYMDVWLSQILPNSFLKPCANIHSHEPHMSSKFSILTSSWHCGLHLLPLWWGCSDVLWLSFAFSQWWMTWNTLYMYWLLISRVMCVQTCFPLCRIYWN